MKAWIKGGLIGGVIGIITFISIMMQIPVIEWLAIPSFPIVNYYCNTFVFPKCTGDSCGCNTAIPNFIYLILLFIIGTFIGFLVGKFRKKE